MECIANIKYLVNIQCEKLEFINIKNIDHNNILDEYIIEHWVQYGDGKKDFYGESCWSSRGKWGHGTVFLRDNSGCKWRCLQGS